MITAKESIRSLPAWMVTSLGLVLSLCEAGCSGMTGFRSVGTERPSFLALWDRSGQPSPTPDQDSYVLSMRAGQARADALAKRDDDDPTTPGGKDDPATPGGTLMAAADSAGKGNRGTGNRPLPDDTTIRVSLGRPEPLPGLTNRSGSSVSIASKGSTSQWKADSDKEPRDDGAVLAEPEERPDHEPAAPTRVVDRSRPAPETEWKAILSRAQDRLEALQTYQMKVTRIERVNGSLQPEEEFLLSVKREPKAVRLEWSSGPSKGREVIYSSTLDPRTLFVHMPSTAIPLPVMKIAVDSPMVTRNSRHSITEAGLDTIIDNLRKSAQGAGATATKSGVVSYQGKKKPNGLDRMCHQFVRKTPSGEVWNVYLDERSLLPCMVVAEDSHGQLIERYVYREIHENPTELAAAGAFEPDKRWGESKGLLGRFARAAAGTDLPGASGATTR
jgi:Protein of unknown function (DUF1571)